ncbi:MipA/OmpV family protein [Phytobacter diazotrophicus]|uniref:MipA/OmpV family protein n=1 Tax=Phytobacter diazotrophicus TaxID=395631 RepID=UPI002935382C|nr:MipA/OmpV family protein [Phytobacter diazotrophicus]MBS6739205.1 MipA/OmpV family protein [Enterobacteriaceae bacterium]MDV2902849.1 MipA/OmpV family protein [Phytobacter diazotrophicus]
MKRSLQYGVSLAGIMLCVPLHSADLSGYAGLGVAVSPIYSGSQHAAPGPLLKGGVSLKSDGWGYWDLSTDGLAWTLPADSPFAVSLLLTPDEGRKEVFNYPFSGRKNRDLQGMGDLSDILMAGAELRYQREGWMVWLRALSATQKHRYGGETQDPGMTLNSGVKATLWHWRDVDFSVAGDITWANGGYQQRHYGVTTSQAQRTDFSVYRPSSGFQLGGVSTGLVWHISENVAAGVSGRAAYLFDEAGKSPLVKSRMQYTLSSLIQYEF